MERGLARYDPSGNRPDLIENGAKTNRDMLDGEKFIIPLLSGIFLL